MSDWVKRTRKIQVGDTVAYSQSFLQSIGQFTGDMPRARGKVTSLVPISKEVTLAEIDWDKPDLPHRVNVKNLTTKKGIALGE